MVPDIHFGTTSRNILSRGLRALWAWFRRGCRRRRKLKGVFTLESVQELRQAFHPDFEYDMVKGFDAELRGKSDWMKEAEGGDDREG